MVVVLPAQAVYELYNITASGVSWAAGEERISKVRVAV
jgi:hypothetical protein